VIGEGRRRVEPERFFRGAKNGHEKQKAQIRLSAKGGVTQNGIAAPRRRNLLDPWRKFTQGRGKSAYDTFPVREKCISYYDIHSSRGKTWRLIDPFHDGAQPMYDLAFAKEVAASGD
jgi:hypothetical protein